ncbi:MAG TPA: HEAT repeat domain-containing protein [Gemmatimonadaceae bacterium]|nr:HEAT repeat domain-containing protein [Gemmatimonadaceae bacterium]
MRRSLLHSALPPRTATVLSCAWAFTTAMASRPLGAQSLDQRLASAGNGTVQFTFTARAGVCGDGRSFIRDSAGGASRIANEATVYGRSEDALESACLPGPVRVVATVADGAVMRLRTYVGPVPARTPDGTRDLGRASVAEAVALLGGVAEHGSGRAAGEAMLPMFLADSVSPWPTLLRVARDGDRPRAARQSAAFWLSRGAAAMLGVAGADRNSDDADVRASAVFAISQQPREDAVPRLIDLARHSKHPDVRAQALFWLGQTGDARGIDLFAELLGVR